MQKLLTFFQQNISIYAIFNDQCFNDTLTTASLVLNNLAQNISSEKSTYLELCTMWLRLQLEQANRKGRKRVLTGLLG